MSKSVTLSPKHGVNPCIPVCFYCGEQKNEIALLGRIGGKADLEAPKSAVLDYEPCEECQKKFAQGVLLIEVTDYPIVQGQPSISPRQKAYPTGRYSVVRPEALNGDFKAGSKALVHKETFEQMFGLTQ